MARAGTYALQSILMGICLMLCAVACGGEYAIYDPGTGPGDPALWGKSDGVDPTRNFEVLFNEPYCDECTGDDKAYLKANSAITNRVIELLDRATQTVDIAQFTFSVTDIEAAIVRAHQRGVQIRMAMNTAQSQGNTVSTRLRDAGVNVQFRSGRRVESGGYNGLQHAKFMVVDATTLLTGSNNWSSTGTSINEENTIVLQGLRTDPLLVGFRCHFDAIWNDRIDEAAACSNDEARFTPGTPAIKMIKDALRAAETSVDVAMHHMLFSDLTKELAKCAERGVPVRVMINAQDRDEVSGSAWNRLLAAGAELRFKKTNADLYQFMHHKLVIVDDTVMVNGSGNWSGSAFFNNYENFVRYTDPRVIQPFVAMFDRLWMWSLTADSLDQGLTAAQQETARTHVFFGNLHAHYEAHGDHGPMDDGQLIHADEHGHHVPVTGIHDGARYAYEYARDEGKMDFMALSPHCTEDNPDDDASIPNMSRDGFDALMDVSAHVTSESWGAFVAIPAMEWSTNSTGNHVNIFGSSELSKMERGRFDLLYEEFLPRRRAEGEYALLQFNHPRTFQRYSTEVLSGNWDQVYDVDLMTIPNGGQRTKKFNDYGLDDYPPLSEVRDRWINGVEQPNRSVVSATLANIEEAARPYVRLMEVTIGRGKEIAHRNGQNPSLIDDGEGGLERFTRVHHDWDYYLMNGFQLAPTAPHDNHFANWGTGHSSRTAIIATALDETTLLDAMNRRAVYASEDENLAIRLYADDRIPMGGKHTTLSGEVVLNVHLSDPDYFGAYEVRVYRGQVRSADELRERQRINDVPANQWVSLPISLVSSGEHVVYLEVFQVDANRMAWTAPIWIQKL